MTRSRDEETGMADLLLDVLGDESPPAELLVRFSDDPRSLSDEERGQVELFLSKSPIGRVQIEAFRKFEKSGAERRPLARAVRVLAAIRAAMRLPTVAGLAWGTATAAAALLAALWFGLGPGEQPELEGVVARVEEPTPQVAQRQEPPPSLPSQSTPTPVRVPESNLPAPAPEVPESRPGTEDSPPPREAERLLAGPSSEPIHPEVQRLPEPLVVAMVSPRYRAPADAPARAQPSSALRGPKPLFRITACAPEHVAQTAEAAPALVWHLSALPAQAGEFWLTIAESDAIDPLLEARLPEPVGAGFKRMELADYGVELPVGREFVWAVAFRRDPDVPSLDVVAQAWIQRVEPSPELRGALQESDAGSVPAVLAADGIWYDAVASVQRLFEQDPTNESVRSARSALLRQVELGQIAEQTP